MMCSRVDETMRASEKRESSATRRLNALDELSWKRKGIEPIEVVGTKKMERARLCRSRLHDKKDRSREDLRVDKFEQKLSL